MTEKTTKNILQNQNTTAALSYLLGPITGVLVLLLEKNNKFVRFHAMQSTILFGGLWIVNFGLGFVPVFGLLTGMILSLIAFIYWVLLMWKAFSGEEYKVPYIGEIARKQIEKISN